MQKDAAGMKNAIEYFPLMFVFNEEKNTTKSKASTMVG